MTTPHRYSLQDWSWYDKPPEYLENPKRASRWLRRCTSYILTSKYILLQFSNKTANSTWTGHPKCCSTAEKSAIECYRQLLPRKIRNRAVWFRNSTLQIFQDRLVNMASIHRATPVSKLETLLRGRENGKGRIKIHVLKKTQKKLIQMPMTYTSWKQSSNTLSGSTTEVGGAVIWIQ